MKLAADQPHQFDALGYDIAPALSIFKATVVKEKRIDEGHLPPSGAFPVEAALGHRVTVARETRAGDGLDHFHLFHFPAGNGRDKNCDDISVYHDAPSAVSTTIYFSLPLAMDS
ncbi:MAG TPA: hypothetical protein VFK65_17650 [Candidatus Binatia bacterium]|nr:hypothetical protein [Candidatus Binatia bacterium]